MADRVSASITIGGILSSNNFADFLDIVSAEGLSPEWDGAPFEVADLVPGAPVTLYAHEVAWGRFETLESWCIAERLPFVRWSGACPGAFGAERIVFTGEGEPQSHAADDDDHVVIGRHTVEKLGSLEAIHAYFAEAAFVPPPFVVVPANPSFSELPIDPIPDVG